MRRRSFLITGGNFYGLGQEAMMLTVKDALMAAFPEALCCAPCSREREYEQYRDAGLIPILPSRPLLPVRAIRRAFRYLGLISRSHIDPTRLGKKPVGNLFRVSDTVIDVTGFGSSDQWPAGREKSRYRMYRLVKLTGNRLIFMPQTWGPFGDPTVRHYAKRLLATADLVIARDEKSYEHLIRLGVPERERLFLAPDIAFQFPPGSPDQGARVLQEAGIETLDDPIIGLTPNMRVYERTQGEGQDNSYIRMLHRIISWFLDNTTCRIALIPHEVYDFKPDDRVLCRMLADLVKAPGRVFLVSGQHAAADLKAAFGHIEFLVASRYHSLVAALSMRIPVAVVGWSHKYNELMRSVGIEQWVTDPVRQPEQAGEKRVLDAWGQRHAIRQAIVENMPKIEATAREALQRMVDTLRSVESGG